MTTAHNESLVSRVVGWIREGYPEGVPDHDYVALYGILQRALAPAELDRVVGELMYDADSGDAIVTRPVIAERIADVVKGPAAPGDIARVSARLAAAGWPLWAGSWEGDTPSGAEHEGPVRPHLVSRVVGWLREGYPSAMPSQDYVALVALLRRRLTDAEVAQVSHELIRHGTLPPDRADVGTAIAKVTSELPSEVDMARVRAYLSAHGWPTEFSL